MFGKKSKQSSAYVDHAVTILTAGCHFSGKLYCKGSSRIGGTIEGELISEGLLIIEEGARILADIQAQEVILQGRVDGSLTATGRVELTKTAQMNGELSAKVLCIKEGAQFNGISKMLRQGSSEVKSSHAVVGDTYPKAKQQSDSKYSEPEIGVVSGIAAKEKSPEVLGNLVF